MSDSRSKATREANATMECANKVGRVQWADGTCLQLERGCFGSVKLRCTYGG